MRSDGEETHKFSTSSVFKTIHEQRADWWTNDELQGASSDHPLHDIRPPEDSTDILSVFASGSVQEAGEDPDIHPSFIVDTVAPC